MVRFGRHFPDFSETEKNSRSSGCGMRGRESLLLDLVEVNQPAGIKLHLEERYFLDLAAAGLHRRDQQCF
jgi:hypothetical protein